jgi:hypothetical protein
VKVAAGLHCGKCFPQQKLTEDDERDASSGNFRVFGGAKRDRTVDLLVANEALSQLSYSPTGAGKTLLILAVSSDFRKGISGVLRPEQSCESLP